MKSATLNQQAPAFIRRSERLIRRTKPIEPLAGPLSTFESAATSLKTRYDEWAQARHDASVALGAQREVEKRLDQEIRAVGLTLLALGQGRRSYEVYRRYFPDGYGSALHLHAAKSLPISAWILVAMNDESDPDVLLRRDRLTAARDQLNDATISQKAAMDARAQARSLLEEEKLAWKKALDNFYFAARAALPDQRSFVEYLFQDGGGRQQPAVEPSPPATAEPTSGTEPAPAQPSAVVPVPLPEPQQNTTVAANAAAA